MKVMSVNCFSSLARLFVIYRVLLIFILSLACLLSMGCQQIFDRMVTNITAQAPSQQSGAEQSMSAASMPSEVFQKSPISNKANDLGSVPTSAATPAPDLPSRQNWSSQAKVTLPKGIEEVAVKPFTAFKDCSDCPQMLRLPTGTFRMGSPTGEDGRDQDEEPVENVKIHAFALGETEVTLKQWREFERQSGYRADSGCLRWTGEGYELAAQLGWRYPGFDQTDEHPVVCISWRDAQAYVQWLSKKVSQSYRLPTEAEWEYAARAGTSQPYPWHSSAPTICSQGNSADVSLRLRNPQWRTESCNDAYPFTAPAGSFPPNNWGLYDMHGNVMEWVENCWSQELQPQTPVQVLLNCRSRVMRGGSWDLPKKYMRSAYRGKSNEANHGEALGFRVARSLP